MQQTIVVGSAVRCTDGKCGTVGGLVINPNTNHLDYVALDPGPLGGRDYYLPIGRVEQAGPNEISMPCTLAELDELPRPEVWTEQGTVQSNIADLCIARGAMPVRSHDGDLLGTFAGATIDDQHVITHVLLDGEHTTGIPIVDIANESRDELRVTLAQQMTA